MKKLKKKFQSLGQKKIILEQCVYFYNQTDKIQWRRLNDTSKSLKSIFNSFSLL